MEPGIVFQRFLLLYSYVSEPNHIYACTELCAKGSLQEVLEDEEVYKLDNMFIASLVTDLVRGNFVRHSYEDRAQPKVSLSFDFRRSH